MRKPVFTDVLQVGFVVRDLDASMRTLSERYGIGPWKTVEFLDGDAQDLVKDDEPASYAMTVTGATDADDTRSAISQKTIRAILVLRRRSETSSP